ncbi:MAG TPA: transposase [Chloroflexi bacterium]|nr:transposase [Chloroflexota bacterium]
MPIYQACQWFGVTPQAYYQAQKRGLRKEAEAQLILALVREIRKRHPRMGAVGNAYDNALAERVNGILKTEYLLGSLFPSRSQAIETVAQAVHLYNFERPHLSLGYATPAHIFGSL